MTADPTPIPAAEIPVDALLTDAEWDALGRVIVPGWDGESATSKRIWRGFARDLATGYRAGLAAGRTAAADLERRMRELTVSTDGDPVDNDAEIPVGEVVRVLAEWRAARVAENGADQ